MPYTLPKEEKPTRIDLNINIDQDISFTRDSKNRPTMTEPESVGYEATGYPGTLILHLSSDGRHYKRKDIGDFNHSSTRAKDNWDANEQHCSCTYHYRWRACYGFTIDLHNPRLRWEASTSSRVVI